MGSPRLVWFCRARRSLSVLLITSLFILAAPALALAAPVVTSMTPVSGATVSGTWNPPVTAVLTSDVALRPLATITLDGRPFTVRVNFASSGAWDTSGPVPRWVVTQDRRVGTLYMTTPPMASGSHTAIVSASDISDASVASTTVFDLTPAVVLSDPSPAPGAVVTADMPELSVAIDARYAPSVAFTLDGSGVSWSYDAAAGRIRSNPRPVSNNATHTASVRWFDGAGRASTLTWSFRTAFASTARIESIAPVPGSAAGIAPVTMSVVDPAGRVSSVRMRIDGVAAVVSTSIVNTTRINATVLARDWAEGTHTVEATATDRYGVAVTRSWSFRGLPALRILSLTPAPGAFVGTATPRLAVAVSSGAGSVAGTFTVGTTLVPGVWDGARGELLATSPPVPDETYRALKVTVRDGSGRSVSTSGGFTTRYYAAGPSAACIGCHTGFPTSHRMTNCDGCHHHGAFYAQPCRACHGGRSAHGPELLLRMHCEDCHGIADPYVPSHPADLGPLHETRSDLTACDPCHLRVLSLEHERHTDTAGVPYGCATCHAATIAPIVRAAVDAADTRCAACHTLGGEGHAAMHDAEITATVEPLSGASCTSCHRPNLIEEHGSARASSRAAGCDACHPAPRDVLTAAWDKGCSTGACHIGSTAIHGRITPAHEVTATARVNCTRNCHSSDLRAEHAKSGAGRTPVSCVACHTGRVAAMTSSWDGTCVSCHAGAHYTSPQAGTADCLACHGTAGESGMAKVTSDSATAFAASGGDHSGTSASAHGAVAPGNAGGVSTGISCEACHSHVSQDAESKMDYRTSGLAATATAQSRLCFSCHSASSEETASGKPFAWNGRDVAAEFARASHHPVMNDEPTMTASPETETVFSQASRPEFDLNLMNNTVNFSGEGPELLYGTVPMSARPNQSMLFMTDAAGTNQYDLDVNAGAPSWNDDGFNPPNLPADRQPLASATAPNRVIVLANGPTQEVWEYTFPTASSPGTWTMVAALATSGGTSANPVGADLAYDPIDNRVYVLPGSGSSTLYRWDIGARTLAEMSVLDEGGQPIQFGQGSALAYSETPRALWLIRSLAEGSTRQGYLYRISEPGPAPATVTAVDTNLHVGGWNTPTQDTQLRQYEAVWNNYKMTRFRQSGVDTLFFLAQDSNHPWLPSTFTVSDLTSTTPTLGAKSHTYPWSSDYNGEYIRRGDLEWDGGDYLYITNAATPSFMYYTLHAAIPALCWRYNLATGVWQTIAPYPGYDGGYVSFGTATPPDGALGTGYAMAGTLTSPEIRPQADAVAWGDVRFSRDVPSGTDLTVKVQGHDGSGWVDLPGLGSVTSQADLSGVSMSTYRTLRLVASFATTDQSARTPRLLSWSVSAARAGRLYVAESVKVPVASWNAIRTPNQIDTRQLMSRTATLSTAPTYIAPFKDRVVYGFSSSAQQVFYPRTQLWNDSRTGITIPLSVFNPYTPSMDAAQFGDRLWVPRTLVNGTPGMMSLPTGPSPTWLDSDGTGATGATWHENSIAVTSTGQYWVPAITTATSQTVWYNRFDTVTGAWKPSPFTIVAADGVTPIYNGSGGGAVYSSRTDTLLLVNRRWNLAAGTGQGDGHLYRVPGAYAKMLAGGNIVATDTGVHPAWSGATERSCALEIASIGSDDYAFLLGWNSAGVQSLQVISGLASATPVVTNTGRIPESVTSLQYFHLDYDDAGTLYYASGWKTFAKVSVPSDPVSGTWGTWTQLPAGKWDGMVGVASAVATISPGTISAYATETIDSDPLLPGDTTEWGWLTWNSVEPSSTDVGMTVQRWTGATWEDVPGFIDRRTSPVDLGSLTTAANPELRVRATLYTADPFLAPSVSNWKVTSGTDRLYAQTDEIVPQPGATGWGSLTWTANLPDGAIGRVSVRGWSSAVGAYVDIPGYTERAETSIDLTGLPIDEWPALQVRCYLQKALPGDPDPSLLSWSVTSIKPVTTVGAQLGCGSCHDAHVVRIGSMTPWDFSRVSDPDNTKVTAAASGKGDATTYCLACHDGAMPGSENSSDSVVPFEVRGARALPGGTPVYWNKATPGLEVTASGHYASPVGRTDCSNCHDPHGSDNARLTAWTKPLWFTGGMSAERDNSDFAAGEENLCYECHGNGGIGFAAPGAKDVASSATQMYAHPIESGGRHASGEPTSALGGANRHAECVDCHDPHAARPGIHVEGSSAPAPALLGAWGVRPTWTGGAATTATSYTYMRFSGQPLAREAYLCFKCHSSYTDLPEPLALDGVGGTDLTSEFNPANMSYHDVLGTGRGVQTSYVVSGTAYAWPWQGTMKNGWTTNSKMTCTDCHTSGSFAEAKGPHGSTVKHMLDPDYEGDWESAGIDFSQPDGMSTNIICAKCHKLTDTSVHGMDYYFGNIHTKNYISSQLCISCHIRVPHGWKRPRMLGYTTDPAPYRSTGLTGVRLRSRPTGLWQSTDCIVGCTSFGDHRQAGTFWP
ncbi:MAG: cytochrome c3 family protein [Coriobacteriia bacterium]|nr:cytochrome c3 family protein [Coriobacteriia bacterium]